MVLGGATQGRSALYFNMSISQQIDLILGRAEHSAILCSWGRDSSLLLHCAREINPAIAIYYLGDTLPAEAARLVVDEGVAIYSFAPKSAYIDRETLIENFSFNGVAVPMLSSVVKSDHCTHDHLNQAACVNFFFPHDVVLWGYRHSDEHPLLPGVKFEPEIQIGHTRFIAPLYDLSDAEVATEINRLSLSYVEDKPIEICDSCLQALAGFQERSTIDH